VLALLLSALLCVTLLPAGISAASAATGSAATATSEGEDTVTPEALLGLPPQPPQADTSSPDFRVESSAVTNHTIDIAVMAPAGTGGSTSFIDDTTARALVSETAAYWKVQSGNQVSTVTPNAVINRRTSSYSCSETTAIWKEAAQAFGHADLSYYVASPLSHHLLVFVPEGCGFLGYGSIGSRDSKVNTGNGGTIWASMAGPNNLDVLAHEFGHNLGLQHSNTHSCPNPAQPEGAFNSSTGAFSDGCADVVYADSYDVMGSAQIVRFNGAIVTNARPTALNATHKDRLGVAGSGEMKSVALRTGSSHSSTIHTLASTGSASGLRSLKITDPLSGQLYFVDFRGGGDMDAGSVYAGGYKKTSGVDIGVRVSTRRASGTSVVLLSPDSSTRSGHRLYLVPDESLTTLSGGVIVNVLSMTAGGTATIDVSLGAAHPAGAVGRLSGADRFDTSAAISASNFSSGVPTVYIANGLNFPDALSAGAVGGKTGSPVLLVTPGAIPSAVQTELVRLRPGKIVVLGGTRSVSDTIAQQLQGFTAGTVTRLSGRDRYATSAEISAASFSPGVSRVYIASGLNFPDALSAAPVAGKSGSPVLLVSPGEIPDLIQTELSRLRPASIIVMGGLNGVSADVFKQLAVFTSGTVTRQSGGDRFATSAAISAANFPPGVGTVYIASGVSFPDALSVAPVGGQSGSPVLLVNPGSIPESIFVELARLTPARIIVLGGVNSVDDHVARQLAEFLP
jgi:putative cell wall-binding protein